MITKQMNSKIDRNSFSEMHEMYRKAQAEVRFMTIHRVPNRMWAHYAKLATNQIHRNRLHRMTKVRRQNRDHPAHWAKIHWSSIFRMH